MSTEDHKMLLRRRVDDIWNNGNMAVVDEVIAADYVNNGQTIGREGFTQFVTAVRAAFPDLQFTIDDMIAEADKLAVRYTGHATHQGEFSGIPPTGKPVTITGIDMFRLADGKIVEEWLNFDQLSMLQQMGVIPTSG